MPDQSCTPHKASAIKPTDLLGSTAILFSKEGLRSSETFHYQLVTLVHVQACCLLDANLRRSLGASACCGSRAVRTPNIASLFSACIHLSIPLTVLNTSPLNMSVHHVQSMWSTLCSCIHASLIFLGRRASLCALLRTSLLLPTLLQAVAAPG